jgi:hypothetical protein
VIDAYKPELDWWLLHGFNVFGSTALFVLFWLTLPEWVRVPYAAFWGAAMLHSLTAYLIRRDLRALESAQPDEAVDPHATHSNDWPRATDSDFVCHVWTPEAGTIGGALMATAQTKAEQFKRRLHRNRTEAKVSALVMVRDWLYRQPIEVCISQLDEMIELMRRELQNE